jgi:hypothetical protein
MRLVFRIRDVDFRDDFRSVDHRPPPDVAQPRSSDDDDDDDEDENYDDDRDDRDDRDDDRDDQNVARDEKAYPVMSHASDARCVTRPRNLMAAALVSLILTLRR